MYIIRQFKASKGLFQLILKYIKSCPQNIHEKQSNINTLYLYMSNNFA